MSDRRGAMEHASWRLTEPAKTFGVTLLVICGWALMALAVEAIKSGAGHSVWGAAAGAHIYQHVRLLYEAHDVAREGRGDVTP